ncbi:hypothetical protein PFLUV_G00048260 [Perca fluviatilis]|uniref:Uncharacterized protein n=1 Tax=Perca fluviatilis TaxID=8168 RepID=A0A6A5ERZ2_PERFL|nr:hypothetical protein PFLUV_G00048260 [Perca fluviatilis]
MLACTASSSEPLLCFELVILGSWKDTSRPTKHLGTKDRPTDWLLRPQRRSQTLGPADRDIPVPTVFNGVRRGLLPSGTPYFLTDQTSLDNLLLKKRADLDSN